MSRLTDVIGALSNALPISGTVKGILDVINAGVQLTEVVRGNIEAAAATASEDDLAVLRARAAELAEHNRALSEQIDALLTGPSAA